MYILLYIVLLTDDFRDLLESRIGHEALEYADIRYSLLFASARNRTRLLSIRPQNCLKGFQQVKVVFEG